MTEAAHLSDHRREANTEAGADLRGIIQRRLVGLAVLLVALFGLSLLLRNSAPSPQALPSVVIPLASSGSIAAGEPASRLLADDDRESEPAAEPAAADRSMASAPRVADAAAEVHAVRAEKPAPVVEARSPVAAAQPQETRRERVPPRPSAPAVKPSPAKPAAAKTESAPRWFVAVGAYKDPMAAQAIANRVKLAGFKADVGVVTVNKDKLQRVRAGPFDSEIAAESARVTLIVEGLTKAVTLSEK